VFTCRKEAERVYALEKSYAELTLLTPIQLRDHLRALLKRLQWDYGVNARGVAALAGISYHALCAHSSGL
jgi:hypothetical protein